jgi:hypothetical protein
MILRVCLFSCSLSLSPSLLNETFVYLFHLYFFLVNTLFFVTTIFFLRWVCVSVLFSWELSFFWRFCAFLQSSRFALPSLELVRLLSCGVPLIAGVFSSSPDCDFKVSLKRSYGKKDHIILY